MSKYLEQTNEIGEPYGTVKSYTCTICSGSKLVEILFRRLIDELPVIALLATQAKGTTIIKDAAEFVLKKQTELPQ